MPLLQQLSHAARSQLCDIFQQVTFPQKAKIVTQGEPGDAFYIVETGILAVIKDGKPVMRLSPGQVRTPPVGLVWCRSRCSRGLGSAATVTSASCQARGLRARPSE